MLTEPLRDDNLREVAGRILAENNLRGAFGANRQGGRLNINLQNFLEPKRLVYDLDKEKLRAEKKKFSWVEVLQRLHFCAGYNGTGALGNVWPVFVDLFCITVLIWIGTGIYLWWKIRECRRWGWAAIGGGVLTLGVLLMTL